MSQNLRQPSLPRHTPPLPPRAPFLCPACILYAVHGCQIAWIIPRPEVFYTRRSIVDSSLAGGMQSLLYGEVTSCLKIAPNTSSRLLKFLSRPGLDYSSFLLQSPSIGSVFVSMLTRTLLGVPAKPTSSTVPQPANRPCSCLCSLAASAGMAIRAPARHCLVQYIRVHGRGWVGSEGSSHSAMYVYRATTEAKKPRPSVNCKINQAMQMPVVVFCSCGRYLEHGEDGTGKLPESEKETAYNATWRLEQLPSPPWDEPSFSGVVVRVL